MKTRDEPLNKLVKSLCYGKEGGLSNNERMQIKVVVGPSTGIAYIGQWLVRQVEVQVHGTIIFLKKAGEVGEFAPFPIAHR